MKPNEIQHMMNKVEVLLRAEPKYRDNDCALWSRVVTNHLGGIGRLQEMTAYELLKMVTAHQLPSYESISRVRRKLQEEFPELRGEGYKKRQDKTKVVKKELGYM